jgi:hypothetical protein
MEVSKIVKIFDKWLTTSVLKYVQADEVENGSASEAFYEMDTELQNATIFRLTFNLR